MAADPVTIACSVAQFVGLAGQAAQGFQWIRQQFIGIKQAPTLIKSIHRELGVLQDILIELSSLQQDSISDDDVARLFEIAFVETSEILGKLCEEVSKFDFQKQGGGPKRWWKQFLVNEKRSEYEEYLRRLERAKSSLQTIMAGMQLKVTTDFRWDFNNFRKDFSTHAMHVEQSLKRVDSGISSIYAISSRTCTNTEDIKKSVDRVAEVLKMVDSSLQEIRADIPALLEKGVEKCLGSRLPALMGKMEEAQSKPRLGNAASTASLEYNKSSDANRSPTTSTNTISTEQCFSRNRQFQGFPKHPAGKASTHVSRIQRKTFTRNITLPIGFIEAKVTQNIYQDRTERDLQERETIRVEITVMPFRWLSSKGHIISVEKMRDQYNRHSWTYTPRSYNIVRDDAMILQACERGDVNAIQSLFKYQQASPFDIRSDGKSLMKVAILGLDDLTPSSEMMKALDVIKFLLSQGADSTPFIREFLDGYMNLVISDHGIRNLYPPSQREAELVLVLEEMFGLCLQHCAADPFIDTAVLEKLWDVSLGGTYLPSLNSVHLFHEKYCGFDDLAFNNPQMVFSDLMHYLRSGQEEEWKRIPDQQYETMVYLCSGGSDSIKARIFSPVSTAAMPRGKDSIFCQSMPSHLLFELLHNSHMERYPERQKLIQRHLYRMLVLLIQSGENPEATCSCEARWQQPGGYRTATAVAAAKGVLGIWERALEECGFDIRTVTDDWRYKDFTRLFEPPAEPLAEPLTEVEERALLKGSIKFVGGVLYSTLSSIV